MRIPEQFQAVESASRAPDRLRAETMAGYGDLFAVLGNDDATDLQGPVGMGAVAAREMNDPLGLATSEASVHPGSPGASAAAAAKQATEPSAAHSNVGNESSEIDSEVARPSDSQTRTSTRSGHRGLDSGRQAELQNSAHRQFASGGAHETVTVNAGVHSHQASAAHSRSGQSSSGAVGGVSAVGGVGGVSSGAGGAGHSGTSTGNPGGNSTGMQNGSLISAVPNSISRQESLAQLGNATFARPEPNLRSEEAQIAPQVAKGLASLVLKDGGTAQIQLRPEALGRVDVELTVRDGVVNASLSAENETARDLLGSELDRLRALLEQRGLRVERLEISPGPDERDARTEPGEDQGGRWTPAQDEPQGRGTDADGRSPWSGGQERAWGGGPGSHAERDGPDEGVDSAETGEAQHKDGHWMIDRRSPTVLSIRLDTVA